MTNTNPQAGDPELIETEAELEDVLARPSAALRDFIKSLTSPLIILGAGGKMGPTLAIQAKRAAQAAGHALEVIAVSRFGDARVLRLLEEHGVETVSMDLFDPAAFEQLPETGNLIHLVGQKFGTGKNPAATWATNVILSARSAECFRHARIVALSTGNVYPLAQVAGGGSVETDALRPLGEYANAAVGRERVFEFCARRNGTRITLLRLFYAVELRYGVLVDIAQKVQFGEPIDLENGYFNCIWQADANEMILRAFALADSPPTIWNLCLPEIFSVREIAAAFGRILGREPKFSGSESDSSLLGNAAKLCGVLGSPPTSLHTMLPWIAHWVKQGGRNLGRPTHFEVRDGQY